MRHKFDTEVRAGAAGAIVSDGPVGGLHELNDVVSRQYYDGRCLLCESVSGEAAERIVLLWNRFRGLSNDDLRELTEAAGARP